jgi:aryl-alcohol dehydrogenase-like predicted oxidoreductase
MRKRVLGRTGLEVSPVAVGGAAFTYVNRARQWDPRSADGRRTIIAMLNLALDRGINYIDTAPLYGNGHSETLVGEVMRERRSECVLASKVWYELDYHGVLKSVDESLERLQTSRIDIMQVHGRMYTAADIDHVVNGGPLEALLRLRSDGKIAHIGLTTEEPWSALPFLKIEAIDVYQIAYNFIYQAAAYHFLVEAAKANVGVVAMRTMTSGILQRELAVLAPEWLIAKSAYEVALKFVVSDSRIHSAIIGTRWPEEVVQNLELIEDWTPPVDLATLPRTTVGIIAAEDGGVP